MAILREYHRPRSVDEALALLAAGGGRLLPLAGGTSLIGQLETRARTDVEGVVDLRDAGLDGAREVDGVLQIGAMCTLTKLAEHPVLRELADGLLVRAARGEGPLNLRNAATAGGAVACAEHDSEMYAALLAMDAAVTARGLDGEEVAVPLSRFDSARMLVTGVQLSKRALRGGAARIARTPSDRPIVAAYAVRDGEDMVRVALCGVALRPVLSDSPLDPPDNFKGSAGYRLQMAQVAVRRARAQLEEASADAG